MKLIFIILFHSIFYITSCNSESNTPESKFPAREDSAFSQNKPVLTDLQKKIVEGAKMNLSDNTEYDLTMGYYVLTFQNGEDKGKKIYPEGDLDPAIGVCTDVIVRSLRYGGVADLQMELHEDIISNRSDYPFARWGNKKPDTNIDHRRVMNLEVWFAKNWNVIEDENFLPGDIVVWDMNQDGASDHIGIVSDSFTGERYKVIHNHPDPGHIADEDKIFRWKITGHYRIGN
ncbi:MAG TPA: DUF1287 domain-containing protein [Ignavibacteria bacterium]|nr:DUF1287 domain-containing protein [Bacteroidota bacterium]HRI85948.1 DUF1287 domain-containing protein [Ignavibacteria bacterium]HRK00503.1 DUF1287 domain-containing protein [Ignavibacteria bacterium]